MLRAEIDGLVFRTFDPKVLGQLLVEHRSPVLDEHIGVHLDAVSAYDAHHAA